MLDWGIITNETAAWVFNILYGGVIIGIILVIILDNRNPVKTLAWILVLMFLPIVGLVLYIFFGLNACMTLNSSPNFKWIEFRD